MKDIWGWGPHRPHTLCCACTRTPAGTAGPLPVFFIVRSGVQEGGDVRWGECSPHDEAFGCDAAAHAAATHAPAADGRVPFFNRPKSTDGNQCPPLHPPPAPPAPPPWHQCRPARRDDERLPPPPAARGGGVSPR